MVPRYNHVYTDSLFRFHLVFCTAERFKSTNDSGAHKPTTQTGTPSNLDHLGRPNNDACVAMCRQGYQMFSNTYHAHSYRLKAEVLSADR